MPAIRSQAGPVEDLVGVDVADAGDDVLVEQQRLQRPRRRTERLCAAPPRRTVRRSGRRRGGRVRAARPRRGRDRTRRPHRTFADRRTMPRDRRRGASPRGCAPDDRRPPAASSTWPLMRRWIMHVSPESSGSSRYLPRRSAASTTVSVSPAITASREVRRTERSRPTSTRSIRRPTRCRCSPRRTVSTSGSSGIDDVTVAASRFSRARGRPRWPRVARRPSSTGRCRRRARRRRRAPERGTSWRDRARATTPRTPGHPDRGGRTVPAAAVFWSNWPIASAESGMRGTTSRSTISNAASAPPSRYTAPSTASNASDRIEGLSAPPAADSPRPSSTCSPSPISWATSASAMRVDHALAQVGQLAFGDRIPVVHDVGDRPAEHGVAEELEAFVADRAGRLGAPRPVGERPLEQAPVGEPVADALGQLGETGRRLIVADPVTARTSGDQLAVARSWT